MKHIFIYVGAFLICLIFSLPCFGASDDQIRMMIIDQSISSYPGKCPCPYSRTKTGRKCGRKSAWSKPGGYEPICYKREISEKMIRDYRKRYNLK